MDTTELTRLERNHELAHARLSVAEEFSWPLSIALSAIAYLSGLGWLGGIAAFAASLWLAPYRYRRIESRAEDEWHRAAGLGRYFR